MCQAKQCSGEQLKYQYLEEMSFQQQKKKNKIVAYCALHVFCSNSCKWSEYFFLVLVTTALFPSIKKKHLRFNWNSKHFSSFKSLSLLFNNFISLVSMLITVSKNSLITFKNNFDFNTLKNIVPIAFTCS